MTVDEQCAAALHRIREHINRSAAAHMREWRRKWWPVNIGMGIGDYQRRRDELRQQRGL
jgi:hypothetical protein